MTETKGAISLVTGGASGIGAAVADGLRGAGDRVFVLDINGTYDIECDVTDPASVDAAIARVVSDAGPPTRVVTSAGIGHGGMLLDDSPEDFRQVLDVNLTGTWLVLRAAARALVEAGQPGSMVAVSSISGTLADRMMGAYCVSKAGVNMLVRIAAVEWARHGIRVNAVGPGVTDTPLIQDAADVPGWTEELAKRTPLARIGTAADVAAAIVGLLEMTWVTGQVLHADGGLALHSPIDTFGIVERAFG